MPPPLAAILLAAGRSSRMGDANKLLLPLPNDPMVRIAAQSLLDAGYDPVIAAVGHEAERVSGVLADLPLTIVRNPDYAEGLSTSLQAGLRALPASCPGALVALGDMPFVALESLKRLAEAFDPETGREIVIPTYHGRRGNPIVIGAKFFPEIHALTGDQGAKPVIAKHPDAVYQIDLGDPGVLQDVDDPQALADLLG